MIQITPDRFTLALEKIRLRAKGIGLEVIDTSDFDPFFKGDLDGKHIWIASALDDEEELFNLLHLIGHCIQWNLSDELRELGSVLHHNPSDLLIKRLQQYEWEANCYALQLLSDVDEYDLAQWLYVKYREDMFFLTNFYKTGEKNKIVTDIALTYEFTWPLVRKDWPKFTPEASKETRRGIVIDFSKA